MKIRITLLFLSIICTLSAHSQIKRIKIGETSKPDSAEIKLSLLARYQRYKSGDEINKDFYDANIYSPKSALIINSKKLYVNSLEGYQTPVYNLNTLKKTNVINHKFALKDSSLFHETQFYDYEFKTKKTNLNIFNGKPVEMCTTHKGKYLWVTYYRRSFDANAIDPSAVAIIDTETDKILRVMPTAPLPKMIASSPDDKYVAITNWGDNTLHIIDISSGNVDDFKYIKHFIIGKKMSLNYGNEKVNRDSNCGYCLRGTTFTPDGKYLLVGRMGGSGGISFFNMTKLKYIGTVFGMKANIRHLEINGEYLYLSSNRTGFVQKTNLSDILNFVLSKNETDKYTNWESCFTGYGARTISTTSDGEYIFVTANNESKVSVVKTENMKIIASITTDSFPVGMEISEDDKYLIVTSQGKSGKGGGNSVMIFKIEYQ